MNKIALYMSNDHQNCDEAFAEAEEAALAGEWERAATMFEMFRDDMDRHFRMEEEILFPALLEANGPSGPVQVMHMEHAQMNDLLEQLAAAVQTRNSKAFGGIAETLLIVMQQHNFKEEQILYPIADRLLAASSEDLIGKLRNI